MDIHEETKLNYQIQLLKEFYHNSAFSLIQGLKKRENYDENARKYVEAMIDNFLHISDREIKARLEGVYPDIIFSGDTMVMTYLGLNYIFVGDHDINEIDIIKANNIDLVFNVDGNIFDEWTPFYEVDLHDVEKYHPYVCVGDNKEHKKLKEVTDHHTVITEDDKEYHIYKLSSYQDIMNMWKGEIK